MASGGTGPRPPPPGLPWQFVLRAFALVSGVALLALVELSGAAYYAAWALIVGAVVSEGLATLVYQRRSRGSR